MSITVLIVDDQELVRAGFRMILDAQPDIDVIGEAGDGDEAVRLAQQSLPDVVLMDIRMPGLDGIAATRILAGPDAPRPLRVVILTTYNLDEYVFDALAAGASGFLLKDVRPEDLADGIRLVAAGDALLAPSVTRRLIAEFAHQHRPSRVDPSSLHTLTPRELEILELIARGQSNAEIAASLYLSENTVKTHVTHVLEKLGLRDRVQAVIHAYETGVIQPGKNPAHRSERDDPHR
jgi:DNA-binding NarL/FixJ family response regulator